MSTETQEQIAIAKPQEQHRWLQKLVGEWTYEGTCNMPDGTCNRFAGTESVHSVGDLWVIAEGQGEMPGAGPAQMITTLGFDPRTGRFTGTWLGSMMTHLWVYDGERNAAGTRLALYSDGPDCQDPGKLAKFMDVIEIVSDEERTLTGHMLGKDGKWQPMMTCRYHRRR